MSAKLKCLSCGDVIYSKHVHDMVWCKCKKIAIDGGDDYCKVTGDEADYIFIPEKIHG